MNIVKDKKKKPGTTLYRIQYKADGKRRRKWFNTKKEAQDFASTREAEHKVFGESLADLAADERRKLILAHNLASEHGIDLFQLVSANVDQCAIKGNRLLSELMWDFSDSLKTEELEEVSIKALDQTVSTFANFKDLNVGDIKRDNILEFLNHNGWATNTKRRMRVELHRFFEWAVEKRYCADNPTSMTKREISRLIGRYEPSPITTFTPDEVRALLHSCRKLYPALLPYYVIGIFCGVRPKEITGRGKGDGILWKNDLPRNEWNMNGYVCLETNKVHVRFAKTHVARMIDIHPNAHAWLQLGGTLPVPTTNLRNRRKQIEADANVDSPQNIMRHTFASYHAEFFRHETDLKNAMGHSQGSTVLYRHYKDVSVPPDEAKEFWNIFP